MSQEILPRPMVLEDFEPHLDALFTADCAPKNVDLTLVEAYPLKNHAQLDRPPFMLIFHSDPSALLLEGLYVLRAAAFEPAAVHIAPTTPAPGALPGYYYQAVFN